MNILVIGSGVLGVTAAYELGKRGHNVSVVDRRPVGAAECSFANGGQLSYCHAEPWATPGALAKLPQWLIDPESPLVVRPRLDGRMIRWGLAFLRNCTSRRARENGINILRLNLYSRKKMAAIRAETGIAFDDGSHGILNIFTSRKDFDAARKLLAFQAKFGAVERAVSREECLSIEPALAYAQSVIVGGTHSAIEETGDAQAFCHALEKIAAERYGARFHYLTEVKALRAESGRIVAAQTSSGDLAADAYVMAAGAYSPLLLRPLGIDIPVYPMKGYSLTLPANEFSPLSSIYDYSHKVVYTRLGGRLRIAGTAEFAGYNDTVNPRRLAPILRAAKTALPKADWDAPRETWACLRPSTPDGCPTLGRTRYANLFLNSGHGTLGWTQAAGSAAVVADLLEGKKPEIMLQGLEMR